MLGGQAPLEIAEQGLAAGLDAGDLAVDLVCAGLPPVTAAAVVVAAGADPTLVAQALADAGYAGAQRVATLARRVNLRLWSGSGGGGGGVPSPN